MKSTNLSAISASSMSGNHCGAQCEAARVQCARAVTGRAALLRASVHCAVAGRACAVRLLELRCAATRASADIMAKQPAVPYPPPRIGSERAPLFGPCRTPNLQSRRLICVKRVLARRRRRKHAHAHEELDGEAECARPPIMHTPHLLVTSSLQLQ